MKTGLAVALAAIVCTAHALHAAGSAGFGPANCVSVSRSGTGSCVLHTKCVGQDLSSFDMSFDCVAQSGRQTHSLGIGSFDLEEDYDTDLKCDECLPPSTGKPLVKHSRTAAGMSLAVVSETREVGKLRGRHRGKGDEPAQEDEPAKEDEESPKDEEPAPEAEWYGPDQCVGVWRDDKSGSCVMQTDCEKDVQLNVYEFGLVCVDQDFTGNSMTRHIFGMGSFGHKETFDTLIKCDKCLALDEYMNHDKAINTLTTLVKGMKDDLQGVSSEVQRLNAHVFPGYEHYPSDYGVDEGLRPQKVQAVVKAPTPPKSPPVKAKPTKPAKFLLHAFHKDCTDVQPLCVDWAKNQQCQENPQYMQANCKKSCNLCGGASGGSTSGSQVVPVAVEVPHVLHQDEYTANVEYDGEAVRHGKVKASQAAVAPTPMSELVPVETVALAQTKHPAQEVVEKEASEEDNEGEGEAEEDDAGDEDS